MADDKLPKYSIAKRLKVIDHFKVTDVSFGNNDLVIDKVSLQCIERAFRKIIKRGTENEQEE